MKLLILGAALSALYVIRKYLEVRRSKKSVRSHPGTITLISQTNFIIGFLPQIPGIIHGAHYYWRTKHRPFAEAGWDVLANISLGPDVTLCVADAAVIKEITTARSRFPKPVERYKVLSILGDNIVVSEGEEWKRYRKVAAPAFNDRNNKLIWDETLKIMLDLFDNVWGAQESIVIDHAISITVPIALFVLSVAAFGQRISWKDDSSGIPPNHQMSFKEAIHEASAGCFTKILVPRWAMGLNEYTRTVRLAFDELESYLHEMISTRQNSDKIEERYDLLSSLLDASSDDPAFTVSDLTGNIFIFLVAGHETTSHTLCFAFALLALYQDEQEILFKHIKSILPDDRLPTYEEMPLFTHSMAVFYETMRLYPPVNGIPKYSAEDTSLTLTNAAGEKRILPVPKGTSIELNAVGLHYNPRYWKNPEEFRPSRFLDPDWPRDAFIPFSAGPRACIGRKFSESEAIAVLTMLVSKYKIEVKEEPQFASETFEERKARVTASKPGVTMTQYAALECFPFWQESKGGTMLFRFEISRDQKVDKISPISLADVTLSVADAAVIKEITTARSRFPKPVAYYKALSILGGNIVASEGEEWKRYRKIAAPGFSDRNNKFIWDETLRIVLDLFNDVWGSQKSIVIEHAISITVPIALFVLSAAAFGQRISWKDDSSVPPNHQMTFKEAIHEASAGCFTKILVPGWAMGLNEHTRTVRLAFVELEVGSHFRVDCGIDNSMGLFQSYLHEMISARRNSEKKEERYDLLSSLLDASSDDPTFTDSDVTGNIFIFLVAGHETTSHTLCFAFALLALYQDEQEILFKHIKSIIPDDRLPTYEEMPLFTQSMAVFYETMRLYPPVNGIPKYSAEDTSLTLTNAAGEKRILPVPKGTSIELNAVGLHYNPRYWKNPEEFRPSRFLHPDWPRDAFIPFSAGPRACIGRKFSESEAIAVLTMLVSKYKIEVKEEPQFASETFEERKARVTASKPGVTMTPIRVPLVFKRR
ncbi:cytochrome P450 [Gymnopus androsaceus JB14]|uniref:Cytochrome P450 n=1 Tax=Gymnopus androsaceus JB14 TaxID=1447944 RepID=A0A6A4H162_9AGAR|nr:cytochrome P450 [Gymnopus androsaceus JB14]